MSMRDLDASEPIGFGSIQGECYGCNIFTELDDLMLCAECSSKLDRDLLRQRKWDCSITAWLTPEDRRESLRNDIIKKYGNSLELISSEECKTNKNKRKKYNKKKR